MVTVVSLLFALGLYLLWCSCWTPVPTRPRLRALDALAARAEKAGLPRLTPARLLLVSLGCGLLVLACGWVATGSAAISAMFAALASLLPSALIAARARRRAKALRAQWPTVVDLLASGIRAGLSLPEAVCELGVHGPAPLRPAFADFADNYRATGAFVTSLDRLKRRLADPVADRICEALRLAREVGGCDLGRLLRTLAEFLRLDAQTRGELEARQSWTVGGARLAVAAPWVVLALLSTRPETTAAYDSRAGVTVLIGGAAGSLVAYRLMLRLGRLPAERRILRPASPTPPSEARPAGRQGVADQAGAPTLAAGPTP